MHRLGLKIGHTATHQVDAAAPAPAHAGCQLTAASAWAPARARATRQLNASAPPPSPAPASGTRQAKMSCTVESFQRRSSNSQWPSAQKAYRRGAAEQAGRQHRLGVGELAGEVERRQELGG